MIQGTASHVGKTTLVSAICRFLFKKNIRVCPFKPQNITSNLIDIGNNETIGYAQYLQAISACNIKPDARMNPVVINITGTSVDFVVKGKILHRGGFDDYNMLLPLMKEAIVESYTSLYKEYDLIVIEGAGSPVEINRSGDDISNMWLANYFQIPVILVSNMEYGGGFASIVGTFELLENSFLSLIKGYVFNKYEGNVSLLNGGIKYIKGRYGKEFLGTFPYIANLNIPEEDFPNSANDPLTNKPTSMRFSDSFDDLAYYIKNIDLDFIY